ncbi:N-6 DNA methylase [Candidatus Woesearchaeota archaeon]|nr:N-6 DNA methylase [Candidatus Woesearchaeota archaeon]
MSKDNSLFKEATIKRLVSNVNLTAKHKKAVHKWLDYFNTGKLENEKQAYIEFANIILRDLLDYDISLEGLKHEEENIEFLFKKDGNNLICFEAKGTKTKDLWAYQGRDKKSRETPVNQINSYMYGKKIPFGILTNYRLFVLFDRNEGDKKYHLIDFTELTKEEKLKEFIALFSREQVEKGFITEVIQQSIVEEREFTKEFYKLYHETRLMLIKEFEENSGISREASVHFAQLYLNRLMFVFFAEDTGKIDKRIIENRVIKTLDNIHLFSSNSANISNVLVGLFNDLDKGSDFPVKLFGFNGGLFKNPIPPKIFFKDFRDDKFFKDVNQYSKLKKKELELNENEKEVFHKYKNRLSPVIRNVLLMASFDFNSEVNVNILGHIFEQSISDIEDLKTEKSSRRKKDGIFYTPEYITDYICRNTIITYLSKKGVNSVPELIKEYAENIEELEDKFKSIKILDPACGSGAFLIKATDVMLEIFKAIQEFKQSEGEYEAKKGLKKKTNTKGQFTLSKWNEEEEAREIIENSIHGVDINEESVEITKLSLFLKMARKNRKLTDLSNNIKRGNSLINDPEVVGDLAFDWEKEFPFKFDVVIGNPPYVRVQNLEHKDIDFLTKNYVTPSGKLDISILFFEKSLNLINESGKVSFISSSQWINTDYGKNLRELLSSEGYLSKILDFGSLPVFEEADTYPSIFILNKLKNQYVDYVKLSKENYDNINTEKIKFKKIDFKNLTSDSWQFSDFNLITHLNKKNLNWNELNKYGKAYIGNITGYDKAFIVDTSIINEKKLEKELIIPYAFKGEEVIQYTYTLPNYFVIYPYKQENDKQVLISEKELKSKYPNIFNYLLKFKDELKKRKDSRKLYANNEQWYKHVRPGSFNYIKPKKIHIKGISTKLEAGLLAENTNFSGANCPAIILFDNNILHEILGILNSKLVSFYLNNICPKKLGGYIRYNAINLSKVPLIVGKDDGLKNIVDLMLKLNKEFHDKKSKFFSRIKKSFSLEKLNKKIYSFYELGFNDFIKEIEKLSKKKLSLKEQDEWEDYFNEYKKDLSNLKNDIEKTDNEINQMVYKLYDLSKEEIQIIEESLK